MSSTSPAPRTAFVHDWLTGMRGGERVLEALLELAPGAPVYTLFHVPGAVSEAIESHPIVTSSLQDAPASRHYYRHLLPLYPTAIEEFDLSAYDLVISTSHCVAKSALRVGETYHLCYCHTPMRYIWDQERAYFPRRTGLVARVRARILAELRRWDRDTAARVDQFVANSRFVAWRIERYYGRQAEVVHPPVDVDYFTPRPGDDEPFVLAVAALAPYKRLELAIEACSRLGIELRVVGEGPERATLERRAEGTATRFLGRIPRADLRQLYRGALCLVQPGVEDFGIAPVEALACGLPVVARGEGGVLDIVESGRHGVLVEPPAGGAQLAAAIDKIRQIRFNEATLRKRAELFSPARFLRSMTSLLDRRRSDLGGPAR